MLNDKRAMYRMPLGFGASAGPRSGPDGQAFDWRLRARRELLSIQFLSDAKALAALLPPGCEIDGEPIVRFEVQNWHDLPWLDGRGYNTFGVKLPVRVAQGQQTLRCAYLAVLWENMPDAILTGREELGYNKIYAELASLNLAHGTASASAHWLGHQFCSITVRDLRERAVSELPITRNDGVLNWKYMPGTGADAPPDANYLTLSPPGSHTQYLTLKTGLGSVEFLPTNWSHMPTQFHIVRTLAQLPLLEPRGAFLATSVGAGDLSDMQRLDWPQTQGSV